MYYTAFKYQGARRIPVETKDAMRNLLEATGFDGDMGDYQYSNKSQAVSEHIATGVMVQAICSSVYLNTLHAQPTRV